MSYYELPQRYDDELMSQGFSEDELEKANQLLDLLTDNQIPSAQVCEQLITLGDQLPDYIDALSTLYGNSEDVAEAISNHLNDGFTEIVLSGYKSGLDPLYGEESATRLRTMIRWATQIDEPNGIAVRQFASQVVEGWIVTQIEMMGNLPSEESRANLIYDLLYASSTQREIVEIIESHQFINSIISEHLASEGLFRYMEQIAPVADERFEIFYEEMEKISGIRIPLEKDKGMQPAARKKSKDAQTDKQLIHFMHMMKEKPLRLYTLAVRRPEDFDRMVKRYSGSDFGDYGEQIDIIMSIVGYYDLINFYSPRLNDGVSNRILSLRRLFPKSYNFTSRLIKMPELQQGATVAQRSLDGRISILRLPGTEFDRYFYNPDAKTLSGNPALMVEVFVERFGRAPTDTDLVLMSSLINDDLYRTEELAHLISCSENIELVSQIDKGHSSELSAIQSATRLIRAIYPFTPRQQAGATALKNSARVRELKYAVDAGLTGISQFGERFEVKEGRNPHLKRHNITSLTVLPRGAKDLKKVKDARYRIEIDLEVGTTRPAPRAQKVDMGYGSAIELKLPEPPVHKQIYKGATFIVDDDMNIWYLDKKGTAVPIETALPFRSAFERLIYEHLAALSYDSNAEGVREERESLKVGELQALEREKGAGIKASHYRRTSALVDKGHDYWYPMNTMQWEAMLADTTTSLNQWRRKTRQRIKNGTLNPDPKVEFLNYIKAHTPDSAKAGPRDRQFISRF